MFVSRTNHKRTVAVSLLTQTYLVFSSVYLSVNAAVASPVGLNAETGVNF